MRTTVEIERIIDEIESAIAKEYDLESLGDCHSDEIRAIMCEMEKADGDEFEALIKQAEDECRASAEAIIKSNEEAETMNYAVETIRYIDNTLECDEPRINDHCFNQTWEFKTLDEAKVYFDEFCDKHISKAYPFDGVGLYELLHGNDGGAELLEEYNASRKD